MSDTKLCLQRASPMSGCGCAQRSGSRTAARVLAAVGVHRAHVRAPWEVHAGTGLHKLCVVLRRSALLVVVRRLRMKRSVPSALAPVVQAKRCHDAGVASELLPLTPRRACAATQHLPAASSFARSSPGLPRNRWCAAQRAGLHASCQTSEHALLLQVLPALSCCVIAACSPRNLRRADSVTVHCLERCVTSSFAKRGQTTADVCSTI